jgi:asparagine synthase (glutamine-hydrolysing)
MSGICGWLGPLNPENLPDDILSEMANAINHNPTHQQESAAFNDTTLSIQAAANRCHFHTDDRFLVAIEGNPSWASPKFAAIAEQEGHAKAAIVAYSQDATAFLQQLKGVFSLAIIERQAKKALLAVDRMGRLPMSYSLSPSGCLVFSSTVSALNQHPDISPQLNEQAIFDYIYFYMVPSPNTIYKEQWKLQPGECLYYDDGKINTEFYWRPKFSESTTKSDAELQEEFRKCLRKAVEHQLSDKAIGSFLSGGLDSSTVSGLLAEVSDTPANTFSIGFDAKGYDEIEYARIASNHFKTIQHEYYVTPEDVASAIPLIAQGYDEPYGNSSAVPTYFCARLAKENGVQVLLAGDGGDELFAGNARYAKQRIFEYYSLVPALLRKGIVEPLMLSIPAKGMANPIRKIQSYIKQANIPLPERMESYNLLHMVPLTDMFPAEFLNEINADHPVNHLRDVYGRAQTSSYLNRMLYLDWKTTLADNDLRKVNNMCSLADIEVRYPMLDDDLVELSTRIPPKLKMKGSNLRYFFKQALQDFLPNEIINKPKHGFGLPFGVWLTESKGLQELAHDNIADFKKRGYMRPDYLDKLIDQHRSEHAAFYGEMLWPLMMLELWLKAHKH